MIFYFLILWQYLLSIIRSLELVNKVYWSWALGGGLDIKQNCNIKIKQKKFRCVLPSWLPSCLFLFRGQSARIRTRPQQHAHTRRPSSPADVPGAQSRPARPRRPPRGPTHQRPAQPSSRPSSRTSPPAPGHPAPPPLQVPHHLWTLPGNKDQAVTLPYTWDQRTHIPPPHEPGHG